MSRSIFHVNISFKHDIYVSGLEELKTNTDEFISAYAINHAYIPSGWSGQTKAGFLFHPTRPNIEKILTWYKEKQEEPEYYKILQDYRFTLDDSFAVFLNNYIKKHKDFKKMKEFIYSVIPSFIFTEKNKVKDFLETIRDKDFFFSSTNNGDLPHQKLTKTITCTYPYSAVFLEQGLGKTKIAIDTYCYKKKVNQVYKMLVICPISVAGETGWEKEITNNKNKLSFVNLTEKTKEERLTLLKEQTDVYIINYEGIEAIKRELISFIDNKTMIVVDESSKIKSYAAARTKNVIQLGKYTDQKMILSGTPITQGAPDLFPQFLFLDKGERFGTSHDGYIKENFYRDGNRLIPKPGKIEQIESKIRECGIRLTKTECIDLPEKVFQTLTVTMTPYQTELYNKIVRAEIIKLESMERVTATNILTSILRLQQITSGFLSPSNPDNPKSIPVPVPIFKNCLDNPKIQEINELFHETINLKEDSVVIWSRFKYDLKTLADYMEENCIPYSQYHGNISDEQCVIEENRFLNKESKVMLSTPQKGGMGKNWQVANYSIYYCNDYSLQNRLQSVDRIHRIGQNKTCNIIDIVARRSIDVKVLQALQAKKNVSDVITGDKIRKYLLDGITGMKLDI